MQIYAPDRQGRERTQWNAWIPITTPVCHINRLNDDDSCLGCSQPLVDDVVTDRFRDVCGHLPTNQPTDNVSQLKDTRTALSNAQASCLSAHRANGESIYLRSHAQGTTRVSTSILCLTAGKGVPSTTPRLWHNTAIIIPSCSIPRAVPLPCGANRLAASPCPARGLPARRPSPFSAFAPNVLEALAQ